MTRPCLLSACMQQSAKQFSIPSLLLWRVTRRISIGRSATAVLVISAASFRSVGAVITAFALDCNHFSASRTTTTTLSLPSSARLFESQRFQIAVNGSASGSGWRQFSSMAGGEDQGTLVPPGRARTKNGIRLLGVCGGIASGKSLASKLLVSELGCGAHIDVDALAHDVYAPGSQAIREIGEAFGPSNILTEDGLSIDRKKLGSIVFADAEAMKRLEAIVWPQTKTLMLRRVQELENELLVAPRIAAPDGQNGFTRDKKVIVVEAAVLLDAGWSDLFDAVWVVRSCSATQSQRLLEHRSMDADVAASRILAQSTRRGIGNLAQELREGTVTAVIENEGTLDQLKENLANALATPTCWRNDETS